jgi:hypothetical protein
LRYRSLLHLNSSGNLKRRKIPLAIVFSEDGFGLAETVAHLRKLRFEDIIIVAATDYGITDELEESVDIVPLMFRGDEQLAAILNFFIENAGPRWLFWCYNGEFLFFPHCESRSISDVVTFMEEERRDSVASFVVDLYSDQMLGGQEGVSLEDASFDALGYYGLNRFGGPEALERQYDVVGGLKWRFEEHVPWVQRRMDRISLFKPSHGLEIDVSGLFNRPEYNTISCPWHNNLTVAIASFRTAKALIHNPGSREMIGSFMAPQSEKFEWSSHQLLELGFMEPGQWF